ncbi:MAG: TrmH family RNA methyltransferase [Candidatus Hydrogenedentota bacterium]
MQRIAGSHGPWFQVGGSLLTAAAVCEVLAPYLSQARRARIAQVIAGRTYSVTPVLEGLYDRGNISAVLRTSEALGYQSVHVIESQDAFKEANRVTQGAEKWLDIRRWATTRACVAVLRAKGYRILATCMEGARPIREFAFDEPAALFFGSERDGISPELHELADAHVVVPMAGFTRSFNISVAAALSLYHMREDRIRRLGAHGDLTPEERERLTAEYYLKSVRNAGGILRLLRGEASAGTLRAETRCTPAT